MYRGNSPRVFPIIIAIIVIALIITALVSVVQSFLGREEEVPVVDPSQGALLDTSGTGSVRMTVRGPIVADEEHRSFRIAVDPSNRTLNTYRGYLGEVIESKQHSNNTKAYEEFVHALDKANMLSGEAFDDERDDTRGICARGKVYEFEVLQSNSVVKRLWTSTCKGSPGSFRASVEQVEELFVAQIPDAKEPLRAIDAY